MEESEDFLSFTSPQSNATPKASRVSTTTLQLLEDDDEVSPTPNPPTPNKPYNTILNTIIPPWITDRSKNSLERKAPPLVRLHNEILQFCQFISPTKEELAARIKAIDEIKRVVLSHWPEAKVHVFGSQLTNILLPSSDIDIAVLDVPIAPDETVTDAILSLTDRIRHSIPVSYLEAVVNARVPIIKYDHAESNLSVDICINHDSGLRTGELILKASEQYPPLKPLSLVLKTFLTQRKLNETYTGGIGSFLLLSMVLSFLQHKQKTSFYSDYYPVWNLGALLLEFFHLYGISFNYFHTGISIKGDGKYFPKYTFNQEKYYNLAVNGLHHQSGNKNKNSSGKKRKFDEVENNTNNTPSSMNKDRPGLFCVENPDAPDQDMGKNSYQMAKVRRSFEHSYQLLTVALNDPKQLSFLCYIIRGNDPLFVDRKFST